MVSNRIKQVFAITSALVLAGAATESVASAASLPAIAGKAEFAQDNNCFSVTGIVGVRQTCTGNARIWLIPLIVNQGSHPVTINATAFTTFTCSAFTTNIDGSGGLVQTMTFPGSSPSGLNSTQTVNITTPQGGPLLVFCSMTPSAAVHSVNFNE